MESFLGRWGHGSFADALEMEAASMAAGSASVSNVATVHKEEAEEVAAKARKEEEVKEEGSVAKVEEVKEEGDMKADQEVEGEELDWAKMEEVVEVMEDEVESGDEVVVAAAPPKSRRQRDRERGVVRKRAGKQVKNRQQQWQWKR